MSSVVILGLCTLCLLCAAPYGTLAAPAADARLNARELAELRELVALADRAMKGEAAARVPWMRWDVHVLRGPRNRAYVPFAILIEDAPTGAFTSVAVYVRVTKRGDRTIPPRRDRRVGPAGADPADIPVFAYGAAGRASAMLRLLDRPDLPKPGGFPYEAAYFTPVWWEGETGIIRRALAVPPGAYDVYITIRERDVLLARGKTPMSGVLKHELDIPDFAAGRLAISSPIVVESMTPISRPLGPEEQIERPYALGTAEIVPVIRREFTPDETLTLVCFVYNAGKDPEGKPDIAAEYQAYRITAAGEEPAGELRTHRLDAGSLPAEFDLRAGHQIAPIQSLPLASFAPGEYRVEIRINDRRARVSAARDLRFVVR